MYVIRSFSFPLLSSLIFSPHYSTTPLHSSNLLSLGIFPFSALSSHSYRDGSSLSLVIFLLFHLFSCLLLLSVLFCYLLSLTLSLSPIHSSPSLPSSHLISTPLLSLLSSPLTFLYAAVISSSFSNSTKAYPLWCVVSRISVKRYSAVRGEENSSVHDRGQQWEKLSKQNRRTLNGM